MKLNFKNFAVAAIIGGIIAVTIIWAGGWIGKPDEIKTGGPFSYSVDVSHFSATTTNATSTAQNIENAKKITLFTQRGDTTGQGNTGISTFSVQVSRDNSNWVTYNKLIPNVTNLDTEDVIRTASSTQSADLGTASSTQIYSLDMLNDNYRWLRCIVVEETDGEHSCFSLIQF